MLICQNADGVHGQRMVANLCSILLVHDTYVWVLFIAHILFMVNLILNATPIETLQQTKQQELFNI